MIQASVVMFADVAGSSGLYKRLGDTRANQIVSETVNGMCEVVLANRGRIIKTIGDEVMAQFTDPLDGLTAAIGIQNLTASMPQIRIGMAWGDVLQKDNDLFGKTVNDAAAVAKIARGGQILTTQEHAALIPPSAAMLSVFDTVRLKGGKSDTRLYRVEWESDDEDDDHTTLARVVDSGKAELKLLVADKTGQSQTVVLLPEDTPYNIGRNPLRCQLIVHAGFVSREHCHIDYDHGNFLLVDHSSNGTHLLTAQQQPVYLRRNSMPLIGEGLIGVGHDAREAGPHVIRFKC